MIRRIFRYVLLFGIACFFFVRQLYVNLLGVDRAVLSALFVVVMSAVGLWLMKKRVNERSPTFYTVDIIIAVQFVVAGLATACYWLAGKINFAQATYSIYYHGFAPLLLYVGFYLRTKKREEIRDWQVVSSIVFCVMMFASVLQLLGIDWWLFRNDNWSLVSTFFGIPRVTGSYGTQIDFGLLCFIFFMWSFYEFFETKSAWSAFIAVLGFVGTVLTLSRIFILSAVVVFIWQFLRPGVLASLKRKTATLVALALLSVVIGTVFYQLNIIATWAEDAGTLDSNETRVNYFRSAPRWLLEDYAYVGSGPGTQNGPNDENKIIGDFLWLGLLVEFGFAIGIIVVVLKVALLLLVILKYLRLSRGTISAISSFVLSVCFLLVSLVDSAFGNMVTISIFYLIVGAFLFSRHGKAHAHSNVRVQTALA
jgi:hypothetical protein